MTKLDVKFNWLHTLLKRIKFARDRHLVDHVYCAQVYITERGLSKLYHIIIVPVKSNTDMIPVLMLEIMLCFVVNISVFNYVFRTFRYLYPR